MKLRLLNVLLLSFCSLFIYQGTIYGQGFEYDLNEDKIIDIHDIVRAAKEKPEFLKSVVENYGEQVITFENSQIENAVRIKLYNLGLRNSYSSTDPITLKEMSKIEDLNIYGLMDTNLSDLSYAIHLRKLSLANNSIADISALENLTLLEELNLANNQIVDIRALAGLKFLEELNLSNNKIVDISPLGSLPSLEELNLSNNSIENIQPLAGLTNIVEIKLRDNKISDITPLEAIVNTYLAYKVNSTYFLSIDIKSNPVNLGDDTTQAVLLNIKHNKVLINRDDWIVTIGNISRSKQDIINKWNELKPTFEDNPYLIRPSVQAPYAPGELNPNFIKDGVNMANFVRYIAGMPDDLYSTEKLNEQAQYGAVITAVYGYLNHYPAKPSDMSDEFYEIAYKSTSTSNLYMGSKYGDFTKFTLDGIAPLGSLSYTVVGYMKDHGENNLSSVGHRRWILSPRLKQIGFGYASKDTGPYYGYYSTMQVTGNSRIEELDYKYTLWPNNGAFPVELTFNALPWSIHINRLKFEPLNVSDIHVTLKRLSDNKTWDFDETDNIISDDGKYFGVDTGGYGYTQGIIFRPDQIEYKDGDLFEVTVQGLKYIDGTDAPIQYQVELFNLVN